MNILVLSDFFPPQISAGAENMALELSLGYLKKGNVVTVITINKSLKKGEVKVSEIEGLICYEIGYSYNEKFAAYLGIFNPFLLKIIKKIILDGSYEMAHLHNIHKYISYSVIGLLEKYSIPSILTVHDAMFIAYGKYDQGVNKSNQTLNASVNYKVKKFQIWRENWKRYNLFKNLIIRLQLKKLKKIVCVSRELEKLMNFNGIQNTQVIHNGIEVISYPVDAKIENFKNKIGLQSSDKVLFFAGRLSTLKGFNQVQDLMKNLIIKDKNIKLLLVGKIINFDSIISKNVINTGWLSKEDMSLAYCSSDLTLVPSIYLDPFPTVVIESMRQGTPVIASVYSGGKEAVVDGITGYLVNPFNISDFSKKILVLLNNYELRKSMSMLSIIEFNKNFTMEICIKKYIKLIN
jgi:glycosyltransferase involved in cell wall biosynthesis